MGYMLPVPPLLLVGQRVLLFQLPNSGSKEKESQWVVCVCVIH